MNHGEHVHTSTQSSPHTMKSVIIDEHVINHMSSMELISHPKIVQLSISHYEYVGLKVAGLGWCDPKFIQFYPFCQEKDKTSKTKPENYFHLIAHE